jgi:hypothetical protein
MKHAEKMMQVQTELSAKMMPVMMNPEYAKLFGDAMENLPSMK